MINLDNIFVFPDEGQMVVAAGNMEQYKGMMELSGARSRQNLVQMDWTLRNLRVLYELGVEHVLDATPFMLSEHRAVEGKYKPMRHQLLCAAMMTLFPRGYNLSSPRTGKSGATVLALDYLQRTRNITGGVLVITTLTTIHGVWKDAIESTIPGARVTVVHGKGKAEALKRPADFYITNYDSVRLAKACFTRAAAEGRIGGVVVDELTHVGNSSSQRHKSIYDLCNHFGVPFVWGLTGSPADNAEMVYGMARTVNPVRLPVTTKSSWLSLTTFQYGPAVYQRALARGAGKIIHDTMQPAIRFDKKDILDLPPVTTQVRKCDLTAEQKEHVSRLKADATTLMQSGVRITAVNGGVLMNKLMQVSLGMVKDDTGAVQTLKHGPRTQALLDVIAETNRQVVVFCGYTAAIRTITEEVRQAGYTCEYVDGSVTGLKRAQILDSFQNAREPRVLVCHPTTTAMGVELSAADTMVFMGVPLTGGFVYAQSIERLSSAKQTASNINIIHIIATAEERMALDKLRKGYDTGQVIAEMFEQFAKKN